MSDRTVSAADALQSRQRPGIACLECRRRKLRCDGEKPRCLHCRETGVACEVNLNRAVRGPKKGHLKALRSRVAELESRLDEQSREPHRVDGDDVAASNRNPEVSFHSFDDAVTDMTRATDVDELIHTELDQLFFDRVHPCLGIFQQRRYMKWSKHPQKCQSRLCLQYAIWSIAALLSVQFRGLKDVFYSRAMQMLESMSSVNVPQGNREPPDIEQAQAWVLIATYESMRGVHQSAWISAGRAFRLVQLMKLHELDLAYNETSSTDPIEIEERRRVFWYAYLLDHLFSLRTNWPITLVEHMICTRLPAAEAEFQSGQFLPGPFLSEAMVEGAPSVISPFNECIVLATICGRSLLYGQHQKVQSVYGDPPADWIEQGRWLEGLLMARIEILSRYYPSTQYSSDPMVQFTCVVAQATAVHIFKTMEMVLHAGRQPLLWELRQERLLNAVAQITAVARSLKDFHCFRLHPMMPLPLLLCCEVLYEKRSQPPFLRQLQQLRDALATLKNVNDPGQSYLDLLGLSCTMTGQEMKHSFPPPCPQQQSSLLL